MPFSTSYYRTGDPFTVGTSRCLNMVSPGHERFEILRMAGACYGRQELMSEGILYENHD